MEEPDARLLAETLVAADLRGIHSHGVLRVPEYVSKLRTGGVNPRGRPAIARDSGSAAVVDGGNAMGQVAADFAMGLAVQRAAVHNVAAVAVRGSNHCGAMFWYPLRCLAHDMIGVAITNALPTMAPWGGIDKIVGINPLAVVIPAGEEEPLVLDTAFSQASHGKIRVYHQKGQSIPANWAFDQTGRATTSAEEAIRGLLQPIGEYKGVGLAIVMGLLATMLSGASYGTELGNMIDGPRAGHDGHFFLALRIGAFEDPAAFKRRIDAAIREIRTSRRAEGTDQIFAPGGLEASLLKTYSRDGIPLNAEILGGLADTARALGVNLPPGIE